MILVVDDHPEMTHVAVRLLERLGYDAAAIAGGQEAIRFLRNLMPKLIILDCPMPCVGGLDVLRFVRGDPPLSKVAVVMFSADADDQTRAPFHQLGIQGWIVKASMDWQNIAHYAR